DGERGQTPFTPAVGVVLQLRERLASVSAVGAPALVARSAALARGFRDSISGLPFAIFPENPSNALTALTPTDGRSAYDIYLRLKSEYGLFVTPNGGALRDRVFRVGHMGNLSPGQLAELSRALGEVSR
ncbi:MAG: hypothetical protein Q8M76_13385, partial [Spirochaetaceae bacterium]|nr:hypothetical protein [Spirochaetaceae bacterium]